MKTKLMRLVSWIKWRFLPAEPMTVPFSEVSSGEVFWWGGECYVKESEEVIFLDEPMPRPFHWRQSVKVVDRQ